MDYAIEPAADTYPPVADTVLVAAYVLVVYPVDRGPASEEPAEASIVIDVVISCFEGTGIYLGLGAELSGSSPARLSFSWSFILFIYLA